MARDDGAGLPSGETLDPRVSPDRTAREDASLRRWVERLRGHPSLQASTLLVLSLPPMLLFPKGSPLFAAAAAEVMAIGSPIAGLVHRHFVRYQLTSFVAQFVLVVAYFAICDRLTGHLGDDAMIFLGAFMTPLVVFPVAILIRLGRSLRQRRAARLSGDAA